MDIILWRHAQAEDLTVSMHSDNERKLTSKGQRQAANMALWLDKVLPPNCTILVSPSQRTLQTAEALGRQFNIDKDIGTGSTADQILAACKWPNNREPVLVIGHQPHLGQIVSKLIPDIQYAAILKGNVWWISHKANGEVFLRAVMAPELAAVG
jgi:phosphohistidine phosphatase